MIRILKNLFYKNRELQNGVLHRAHTTRYEDLCQ
jgi:hypothetical protein